MKMTVNEWRRLLLNEDHLQWMKITVNECWLYSFTTNSEQGNQHSEIKAETETDPET